MFEIWILFVKQKHFISPPASLTPLRLPFIPLCHPSVFCLVLSSSAQWQEQETSRYFKKPQPYCWNGATWSGSIDEWTSSQRRILNLEVHGSPFHNTRLFSQDCLCAQASVFLWCCTNLLLCRRKSLLPLSLQRSCLLRLPWENVSAAAEGERWGGICCCGSEKSGRDSPKQITRVGVDAHTGLNFFVQRC